MALLQLFLQTARVTAVEAVTVTVAVAGAPAVRPPPYLFSGITRRGEIDGRVGPDLLKLIALHVARTVEPVSERNRVLAELTARPTSFGGRYATLAVDDPDWRALAGRSALAGTELLAIEGTPVILVPYSVDEAEAFFNGQAEQVPDLSPDVLSALKVANAAVNQRTGGYLDLWRSGDVDDRYRRMRGQLAVGVGLRWFDSVGRLVEGSGELPTLGRQSAAARDAVWESRSQLLRETGLFANPDAWILNALPGTHLFTDTDPAFVHRIGFQIALLEASRVVAAVMCGLARVRGAAQNPVFDFLRATAEHDELFLLSPLLEQQKSAFGIGELADDLLKSMRRAYLEHAGPGRDAVHSTDSEVAFKAEILRAHGGTIARLDPDMVDHKLFQEGLTLSRRLRGDARKLEAVFEREGGSSTLLGRYRNWGAALLFEAITEGAVELKTDGAPVPDRSTAASVLAGLAELGDRPGNPLVAAAMGGGLETALAAQGLGPGIGTWTKVSANEGLSHLADGVTSIPDWSVFVDDAWQTKALQVIVSLLDSWVADLGRME